MELHAWSRLYKTGLLKQCQELVPDGCDQQEDMALSAEILTHAQSIYLSHYNGYHYCKHPGSMTGVWQGQEERDIKNLRLLMSTVQDAFKDYQIRNSYLPGNSVEQQTRLMIWHGRLMRLDDWKRFSHDTFLFPYGDFAGKERILLYGNGKFGRALQRFIDGMKDLHIVGIADRYSEDEKIIRPDELSQISFDALVVTIMNFHIAGLVYEELLAMGISKEKIFLPDVKMLLETEIPA